MSFDNQPVLNGDIVKLRPLRPGDFDHLFEVASDPLIWTQHPDPLRYEEDRFRSFFEESLASGRALTIIDAENQQIIGSSRYHGFDAGRSEIEIGWTFLARSYWGGKYNGQVKQLMLQHAFRYVERVIFLVGVENVRSQRAVEKLGAVRAGARPDAGGRESYLYQITARNFEPR